MPGRKRRGRKPGRPQLAPAPAPAANNVVANLLSARNALLAQRDAIEKQLDLINQALAAASTVLPRRRGRPLKLAPAAAPAAPAAGRHRPGSLKDFIVRVLSAASGPMSVKDIAAGVLEAGYKSKNRTLAKSVGIALAQMPEVARVRRGVFRLK
jgi:hypothetical protein